MIPNVTMRLAETAPHGENRKFDVAPFANLRTANNLSGEFVSVGKPALDFGYCFFTQVVSDRFAFQLLVRVAEQREMSAVLLEIKTVRIDDGDRFF